MFFFGPQAAEARRERGLRRRGRARVSVCSCGAVWQYDALGAREQSPALSEDRLHLARHRHRPSELSRRSDGTPADFKADAGFLLDPLSSIWLLFVTGVGMLIHIYSTGYMAHEGGYYRFFGYLNLFMFSMLTLILANNYVLMFVGLGGRGPVFVPADRLLFPPQVGQ